MAKAPVAAPNEPVVDDDVIDDDNNPESGDENPEPVVAPVVSKGKLDFSKVPEEMKPFLEAVRAQEKVKLYGEITRLKTRIDSLEKPATPVPPVTAAASAGGNEEITQLRSMVERLENTIATTTRKAQLNAFRAERIAEVKDSGVKLVESIVGGDSEEAIEASIQVAIAERLQVEHDIDTERRRADNGNPPVIINNNPRATGARTRVEGVPPVNSGPTVNGEDDTLTAENLRGMLSDPMAAVRDGSYAQNRKRIHAALAKGNVVR